MEKDYFEDIVPPDSAQPRSAPNSLPGETDESSAEATRIPINTKAGPPGDRSIRNIAPPPRQRPRYDSAPGVTADFSQPPRGRRAGLSRFIIWGVALACVLVLAALVFVALRPTRVTVLPRTHALNFAGEQFTAYPEQSAPAGALAYTVQSFEIEDSETVASEGTVYAEEKATGNVTVYNNYQTAPLRLVKNTRFETPSGLIFRTPSDIVVPGKSAAGPGTVQITVIADQPGDTYNVPAGRFTVPGLKSTPAMYSQVYAESSAAFAGGFAGERPGVAPAELERTISAVRARLETKAKEQAGQAEAGTVALDELLQIEYESLPVSTEEGGSVRINQRARVYVPIFLSTPFASAVSGSSVSASDTSKIRFVPADGFSAKGAATSTNLNVGPLSFSLDGGAMLVWEIDEPALQSALAGKDKSAFEAIAADFPSIQEANARIEPFWKDTFPTDPGAIKIKILKPEGTN